MTVTDIPRDDWLATANGMDELPLFDAELESLRTVLFDTGEGIPRETQLELRDHLHAQLVTLDHRSMALRLLLKRGSTGRASG